MADRYDVADSIDAAAQRLGIPAHALIAANRFGINGVPEFAPGTIWVPCLGNWPEGVGFYNLADPVRCADGSIQGTYSSREGDDLAGLAARFGVTEAELVSEYPGYDYSAMTAGDVVNVCMSWFE